MPTRLPIAIYDTFVVLYRKDDTMVDKGMQHVGRDTNQTHRAQGDTFSPHDRPTTSVAAARLAPDVVQARPALKPRHSAERRVRHMQGGEARS